MSKLKSNVAPEKWNDWRWQTKNQIRTVEELEEFLNLTDEEREEIKEVTETYAWETTPYFASLMDPDDPKCPIRQQALPVKEELYDPVGVQDPLKESEHQPVKGVVRVYPDRVAFTISNKCAMLCRHCFRKEYVNMPHTFVSRDDVMKAVDWIRETPEIRDVLLTGGDPFLNDTEWLEEIIAPIREIEHVEIIRIGSRTPSTMPQRITPKLVNMLKKYHPLWVNVHFNHPKEITEEAKQACGMLADAGIPLGNQCVLLKGLNDDSETQMELVHKLVEMRVRPYYLLQCQILHGTAHFRTPIETGIDIIHELQGWTTGFAIPTFLLDTPYGKCPMFPQRIVNRDRYSVSLKNFRGEIWTEPNPMPGYDYPEQE